jgi:hypothetical protein
MSRLPLYTLTVEREVLCCVDIKRGLSITNGAEAVVADLAANFPDNFDGYRIIYCDTEDIWDGIGHRGAVFTRFVHLQTKDRQRAIALARAGIDANGNDWPN